VLGGPVTVRLVVVASVGGVLVLEGPITIGLVEVASIDEVLVLGEPIAVGLVTVVGSSSNAGVNERPVLEVLVFGRPTSVRNTSVEVGGATVATETTVE
jgi:hypothetical protein